MASLHVRPAFAADDQPDKARADAETLGNVGLGVAFLYARPDFPNVIFGQLRHPVSGASSMATFRDHVCGIVGACAEEQMRRVNAFWAVAAVADAEAGGDIAAEKKECHAVRPVKPAFEGERAVPIREPARSPDPTLIPNGNLGHESLYDRDAVKLDVSHVSLLQGSLVRLGRGVRTAAPGRSHYTSLAKEA